ncbi:arylsulfotransferase (asst) [Halosimplex pelagicum]|uniref:Arylsulfotransferase (Asst) n=1 Tax=Halosimplex pelagicum TaxID=869886 RepID=A0A7D5T7I1_9EURY|nr:arylsulfotransferase (asst) [Halosimplex pelagicum]QLH80290.1 arylsulfotransferase (asst) [Halosimplex pelagicum]
MPDRRPLRLSLALVVVLATGTVAVGYVAAERSSDQVTGDPSVEQALRSGDLSPVIDPRDGRTVVATDSNAFVADENDGPRAQAELVAFARDGGIYYHENDHTRYWDVDPVAGTNSTVEFVYADHLDADECDGSVCTRNGVERVNLTTGESTDVFSRVTPGKHSTRWHDIDRIDEERLLVADIDRDRVFVVNTTTGLITWEWGAQAAFDVDSGGPFPKDWTHLNDVEHVEIEGRDAAMVSLRNHDQVAFVDFERGLMENWTLGADGDHDTLYEQHNPDYIPPERGGPALLVADSENGRVVEYQREDGTWNRSWTWSDARMQWPRDADRLPNGHTLITDSNGDRVFEVDRSGEVVWTATIGFPYEAERLGSGEESAGGESAAALALPSHEPDPANRSVSGAVMAALPPSIENGVAYVFPRWVGVVEGVAIVALLVAVPLWARLEYRWSDVSVGVRNPLQIDRE